MQTAKELSALVKRVVMPSSGNGIDFFKAEVANPSLMQRIRIYDPALIVYHDSNVARWGVGRLTPKGIAFLFLWQTDPGGQYLPLDDRLMDAIAHWDLRPNWKQGPRNADEEAKRRDEADLARAAKAEKDFDDDISHLTRANRRQLAKALEAIT